VGPIAWLPLGPSRRHDFLLDSGQKARFLFLDAPCTTITIVIEAPTRKFSRTWHRLEVLDSVAFE
jgi:hypothetical protein